MFTLLQKSSFDLFKLFTCYGWFLGTSFFSCQPHTVHQDWVHISLSASIFYQHCSINWHNDSSNYHWCSNWCPSLMQRSNVWLYLRIQITKFAGSGYLFQWDNTDRWAFRSSIGYGPLYCDCKGLPVASCLTNTCVAVTSAGGKRVFLCTVRGGVGRTRCMWHFSWDTRVNDRVGI